MHSNLRHRHPARAHEKREELTLENSGSLANVVEREAAVAAKDDVATVYSVVYVTASATFSGPTAGYVTVGLPSSASSATGAAKSSANNDDDDATSTKTSAAARTSAASSKTASATASVKTTATVAPSAASTKTGTSTASSKTQTTSAITTSAALSSTTSSSATSSSVVESSSGISGAALAEATSSASASPSASSAASSSSGLSSGAKGGIAFAVILAVALVAGIAFFCIRRKKAQRRNMEGAQRLDDEKRPAASAPIPAVNITPAPYVAPAPSAVPPVVRSTSPAPRLSIRPTSGFSLGTDPEKAAASIGAVVAAGAAAASNKPSESSWERRPAQSTRWPTAVGKSNNSTTDPANPFGIHAETVNGSAADKSALKASGSTASFELQGSPVPANTRHSQADLELALPEEPRSAGLESASSDPMSPSKAEFGTASAVPVIAAAAVAAASGGAQPLGNNVHRVQLEFLPTRDDEFELKPGQLVRIAHEYDDGWVLCMSMDRSKQGAAPRTCLSKLPLKPRAPPGRPMSPMGPPPPGMRKVSAPARPIAHNSMVPAPLSPAMTSRMPSGGSPPQQRQRTASGPQSQPRSRSPAPRPSKPMADSRPRSASVGSANNGAKPTSPVGPSPLNATPMSAVPSRKPVPGQAI